jgi:hypothetical protein
VVVLGLRAMMLPFAHARLRGKGTARMLWLGAAPRTRTFAA